MFKKLFITAALLVSLLYAGSTVAADTLWGYYASQGESLPSLEERAIIAAENGIFEYFGTAKQNTELLFRLENPAPPALGKNAMEDGLLGVSVITNYRSQLRSPMTSSQTTIPVSSLLTTDGTTITTALLDGSIYLTAAPGATNQEIIKCTVVTVTDFSGCTRGLAFSGTSESSVSANRKAHSAGTVIVMSNVHYIFNNLIDGQTTKAQSITGPITFASSAAFTGAIPTIPTSTPTQDAEVVSKGYLETRIFTTSTSNKIVVDAIAGDTVAENNIVYFDETDEEWKLASATFVNQANYLVGLAMGAGTNGNAIDGGVMTQGIKTGFSGLDSGEPYFMSDTAGDISTSVGTITFELGYAQSATQLYFFPKFKSFLTKDQKDALQGTSGTPSNSNRYVTDADTATTSTADKVVRANGSGKIDPSWQYGQTMQITAGETLTQSEAVFISTGLEYNVQNQATINSTVTLNDSLDRQGQTITLDKATKLVRKIDIYTAKTGSPSSASLTLEVFAVSGGSPTGAALATVTVADASITNGGYTEFQFSSDVELTGDTQYAFVLSATNVDGSNNYQISISTSSVYSGGIRVSSTNGGSSWTQVAASDLVFRFYEKTGEQGKAYKTTADTLLLEAVNGFVGFTLDTSIADGATGFVIVDGQAIGFSGLTIYTTYFLSDTFGEISSTRGTLGFRIGKTESETTNINVDKQKKLFTTTGTQSASSNNVVVYTGFRPDKVRMRGISDQGYSALGVTFSNGIYDVNTNKYATVGLNGDGAGPDAALVTDKVLHIRYDNSPEEHWFAYIIDVTEIGFTIDFDYDATMLDLLWLVEVE